MEIAGIRLKNPVMPASGTFGSGQEYSGFVDLNQLGAVVTKGVSCVPWEGNPAPRIMETASGMINAVGLQNPGIDVFIERDLPFLRQFDTKVIVNICGSTVADYLEVVERLSGQEIDMLEANISCPKPVPPRWRWGRRISGTPVPCRRSSAGWKSTWRKTVSGT